MTVDYDFLESFIDEQKSIFEKERDGMSDIISVFIQEFRANVIQTGSVCAFIVTILFGIITVNWIDELIGQTLIGICIIVATGLIFSTEYFRNKFLLSRLQIRNAYDTALWTMSELKRVITIRIVLNEKMDYQNLYFFIFCAVCSERIKILATFEDLLKNPVFKMKARDYVKFYSEYEQIIKAGKIVWENYSDKFKSADYLKNIIEIISPLENYKVISKN